MLASWKKSYYKPRQLIKKQRRYFADKYSYSQSYYFSIYVIYGCESWTIKKVESERIDASNWCWWRVLWTARRSNWSIQKEINLEYSLKGLMLKLQYFSYLMWRASSLENTLILGKREVRRRRGQQKMRWLDGITNSMAMRFSHKLQGMVRDREA